MRWSGESLRRRDFFWTIPAILTLTERSPVASFSRACKRCRVSGSLKDIAAACSVSIATVSRALSNRPYVRSELRARIRQEAQRLSYHANPLVGSLMAHVRRTRANQFLGNLALVHVPVEKKPEIGPQEKRILESARSRAKELGFFAEIFTLQSGPRGEAALARMLRARGISGALFAYPQPRYAPAEFPWSEFSTLALDFSGHELRLNTVCHDHFASISLALRRLREMGYRRIGLFIEQFKDARTHHKWSAGFRSFQEQEQGIGQIPVLMEETMNEAAFAAWFRRHKPDLVIGHFDDCIRWLAKMGRDVPRDVGFFNLNWLARTRPGAGIDPQLELQGQVCADALVSQVQQGQRGLPETPRLIQVRGKFVAGPTIRGG